MPLAAVPEDRGWVPAADFVPWVESYREATGHAPCPGILGRAVPLCLEQWDCHSGLLVPFDDAMQAFFSAGMYEQDQMVVMSVWGDASDSAVACYGGREMACNAEHGSRHRSHGSNCRVYSVTVQTSVQEPLSGRGAHHANLEPSDRSPAP